MVGNDGGGRRWRGRVGDRRCNGSGKCQGWEMMECDKRQVSLEHPPLQEKNQEKKKNIKYRGKKRKEEREEEKAPSKDDDVHPNTVMRWRCSERVGRERDVVGRTVISGMGKYPSIRNDQWNGKISVFQEVSIMQKNGRTRASGEKLLKKNEKKKTQTPTPRHTETHLHARYVAR